MSVDAGGDWTDTKGTIPGTRTRRARGTARGDTTGDWARKRGGIFVRGASRAVDHVNARTGKTQPGHGQRPISLVLLAVGGSRTNVARARIHQHRSTPMFVRTLV